MRSDERQRIWIRASGLLLILALVSGCRLYRLERSLSPPYDDFLSKVRYIISTAERKIFLELPDSEKDAFIEDFWRRRDLDPDTEENEFKAEYFERMKETERLFKGEGRPGWLTDRGRIYILFGAPLDRIIDTSARSETERCREVWYYGDFPIVFRDQNCNGQFKLITYDLTSLRVFNLTYMHELNLAQADARKIPSGERPLFDFDWRLRKTAVGTEKIGGIVIVSIPYSVIWPHEDAEWRKVDIEVELALRDVEGDAVWEHRETFEIAGTEDEFGMGKRGSFRRRIPFRIEDGAARLRRGKNTLTIRLKDLTGGQELRKEMTVEF